MEILLILMILFVLGYGVYEGLKAFFRSDENLKKAVSDSDKGFKDPGELLKYLPELSPPGKQIVTFQGKRIERPAILTPKYQVCEGGFILTFDNKVNYNGLKNFNRYIAEKFYPKVIPTPIVKIVDNNVGGDPYVIRYEYSKPKIFVAYLKGAISKIKETYHSFLESKVSEKWTMFFGDAFDLAQDIAAQILIDLFTSPHTLVIGGTGSGKTSTIKSLVYAIAMLCPNVIAYFSCGKGSSEYDRLAKKLSSLPVAKPANGQDPMVNLAEMVLVYLAKEWKRRIYLFQEAGVNNFVEYNRLQKDKKKRIGPLLFVLDEFAAWMSISPVTAQEAFNTPGTIWDIVNCLLAQGRSYGIVIIIGSQKATSELPTAFRTNLNQWLVHLSKVKELNNIDISTTVLEKLQQGQFVFKKEGYYDSTGSNDILATMPFLDENSLIDELDVETPEKFDFNGSLIYPTGIKQVNETIDNLANQFKEFFIRPAGWIIEEENIPSLSFTAFRLIKGEQKLHVSFAKAEDLHEDSFFDRFNRYVGTSTPGYSKVVFAYGSSPAGKQTKLRESFENSGCGVIFKEDYSMILGEARKIYYETKTANEKFDTLLKMYSIRPKDSMAPVKPSNKIELNKEFLMKIMKMPASKDPAKDTKGAMFEQLLKETYIFAGYHAWGSVDLFKAGYRKDPGIGDGGLDLMILPRLEGEEVGDMDVMNIPVDRLRYRIGIQAKNYNKSNLGNTIASDLVKSAILYTGPTNVEITELWIVHTNGIPSGPLKQEVDEITSKGRIKMKIFSMNDIIELFPKVIDSSEESQIIFSDLTDRQASDQLKKIGTVMSHTTVARRRATKGWVRNGK